MLVEVGNKTPKKASSTTAAGAVGRPSSEQDRSRFQNVVLPHLADAYELAYWLTGNRADAEDVSRRRACMRFAGSAALRGSTPELGC